MRRTFLQFLSLVLFTEWGGGGGGSGHEHFLAKCLEFRKALADLLEYFIREPVVALQKTLDLFVKRGNWCALSKQINLLFFGK